MARPARALLEAWTGRSRRPGWRSRWLLPAFWLAGLLTVSTGCGDGEEVFVSTPTSAGPTSTTVPASSDLLSPFDGIFVGEIDTGVKAAEGEITLWVDHGEITDVDVTLTQVVCDGLTVGEVWWSLYDGFGDDAWPWRIPVSEAGEFGGAIGAVNHEEPHEDCLTGPYGDVTPEDMEGVYSGADALMDYRLDVSHETFPVVTSFTDVGRIEGRFSSEQEAEGSITIFIRLICTDRACELGTFPWTAAAQ